MNKPVRTLVLPLMSMLLLTTPALAQPVPPPPPPAEAPASDVPVPPPPPVDAVPATTDAPPPAPPPPGDALPPPDLSAPPPATIEDRVGAVEGRVDGIDESLAATKATVDKLNRIKLSGYIQGRYEWHDDSTAGATFSGGTPSVLEKNRFLVRRGRLKVVYDGTNAEFLLQIDAVGASRSLTDGVTLKDAEATFVDTWTPFNFRLTMGQFKWPFGYEVLQSSGDREMPERSAVIRNLFPGERDRGVRLTARWEWLRFAAALVNGVPGTQDSIYGANDSNSFKDVVLRVGADFGFIVGGISGYFGRQLKTTPPPSGMNVPSFRRDYLLRLGADAQFYYDVEGLGGLAIKGEIIYAKDTNASFRNTAADGCKDIHKLGWIVTAVQNVGDYLGAVLRIDSFDPNFTNLLGSDCTTAPVGMKAKVEPKPDRVTTYGGGVMLYPSGNLKGSLIYEHVSEQGPTVANDVFTAQLQARF